MAEHFARRIEELYAELEDPNGRPASTILDELNTLIRRSLERGGPIDDLPIAQTFTRIEPDTNLSQRVYNNIKRGMNSGLFPNVDFAIKGAAAAHEISEDLARDILIEEAGRDPDGRLFFDLHPNPRDSQGRITTPQRNPSAGGVPDLSIGFQRTAATGGVKVTGTTEGLTPEARRSLEAAIQGAAQVGLERIHIAATKASTGHKSHGAGTEYDIIGYRPGNQLWTREQRVAVLSWARDEGADRFGLYSSGRTAHVGHSRPGFPAAYWGANQQTSGPASRLYTVQVERDFLRGGTTPEFMARASPLARPNAFQAFASGAATPVNAPEKAIAKIVAQASSTAAPKDPLMAAAQEVLDAAVSGTVEQFQTALKKTETELNRVHQRAKNQNTLNPVAANRVTKEAFGRVEELWRSADRVTTLQFADRVEKNSAIADAIRGVTVAGHPVGDKLLEGLQETFDAARANATPEELAALNPQGATPEVIAGAPQVAKPDAEQTITPTEFELVRQQAASATLWYELAEMRQQLTGEPPDADAAVGTEVQAIATTAQREAQMALESARQAVAMGHITPEQGKVMIETAVAAVAERVMPDPALPAFRAAFGADRGQLSPGKLAVARSLTEWGFPLTPEGVVEFKRFNPVSVKSGTPVTGTVDSRMEWAVTRVIPKNPSMLKPLVWMGNIKRAQEARYNLGIIKVEPGRTADPFRDALDSLKRFRKQMPPNLRALRDAVEQGTVFSRTGQHGGDAVVQLQRALTHLGIPTEDDGFFGEETERNVKLFQQGFGFGNITPLGIAGLPGVPFDVELLDDGKVGPLTTGKLARIAESAGSIFRSSMRAQQVEEVVSATVDNSTAAAGAVDAETVAPVDAGLISPVGEDEPRGAAPLLPSGGVTDEIVYPEPSEVIHPEERDAVKEVLGGDTSDVVADTVARVVRTTVVRNTPSGIADVGRFVSGAISSARLDDISRPVDDFAVSQVSPTRVLTPDGRAEIRRNERGEVISEVPVPLATILSNKPMAADGDFPLGELPVFERSLLQPERFNPGFGLVAPLRTRSASSVEPDTITIVPSDNTVTKAITDSLLTGDADEADVAPIVDGLVRAGVNRSDVAVGIQTLFERGMISAQETARAVQTAVTAPVVTMTDDGVAVETPPTQIEQTAALAPLVQDERGFSNLIDSMPAGVVTDDVRAALNIGQQLAAERRDALTVQGRDAPTTLPDRQSSASEIVGRLNQRINNRFGLPIGDPARGFVVTDGGRFNTTEPFAPPPPSQGAFITDFLAGGERQPIIDFPRPPTRNEALASNDPAIRAGNERAIRVRETAERRARERRTENLLIDSLTRNEQQGRATTFPGDTDGGFATASDPFTQPGGFGQITSRGISGLPTDTHGGGTTGPSPSSISVAAGGIPSTSAPPPASAPPPTTNIGSDFNITQDDRTSSPGGIGGV